MLSTIHKTHNEESTSLRVIIMLSAWGFALVAASFLFFWLGYLLDEVLGTGPIFMLGFFFTAIVGSFIELFDEAWKILRHV